MDAAKVAQLKLFVQQCEANPAILQDPSLAFFRSYLEKSVSLLPFYRSRYGFKIFFPRRSLL
jgi:suppressor of tumorigenicity protein 13